MKYAEYDLSKLPVVQVMINKVDVSISDYKNDVLAMQTKILNDHSSTVWIINSKHTKLLPSEHRIAAGNWIKENMTKIKERVIVVILIECSFWTEMVLKSIFLVNKPPVRFEILKDLDAAEKFINTELKLNVKIT